MNTYCDTHKNVKRQEAIASPQIIHDLILNFTQVISTCSSYIVNFAMCRVQFIKEYRFTGTKLEAPADLRQIVVEGQAYYDPGAKQVVYRKGILGGNSILPNTTLVGV
jgi:hypothetical protein